MRFERTLVFLAKIKLRQEIQKSCLRPLMSRTVSGQRRASLIFACRDAGFGVKKKPREREMQKSPLAEFLQKSYFKFDIFAKM